MSIRKSMRVRVSIRVMLLDPPAAGSLQGAHAQTPGMPPEMMPQEMMPPEHKNLLFSPARVKNPVMTWVRDWGG